MQEKKRKDKTTSLPELTTSVTEILVANGRSFQPFIRTFSYTGENVTKAGLGTLVGVFEIDDQSEDSAYIVNFLASVAKKEYFSNPRRGAIESFEAALHKINLALAELVKHGNVTWLGKLHGALGVLEKNNLHFSVTGQSKILLLRGENLADISDGLASDESSIHPIKTFVEVSSGRLMAEDQALLTSPELLALFSLEELSRHAVRMDRERFTQFLKTALVNELDMAGLIVTDVYEGEALSAPTPQDKPRTTETTAPVRVNNVFSQSAFASKKPSEAPSVEDVLIEKHIEKEEYIDNKTGHIYVQGDTPIASDQHPWLEALSLRGEEWLRLTQVALTNQSKNLRKLGKRTSLGFTALGETTAVLGRRTGRVFRRAWRKIAEAQAKRAEERAARARLEAEERALAVPPAPTPVAPPRITDIPRPAPLEVPDEAVIETVEAPVEPTPPEGSPETEMPDFLKGRLASFYQRQNTSVSSAPDETPAEQPPKEKMTLPRFDFAPWWQGLAARIDTVSTATKRHATQLLATLRRLRLGHQVQRLLRHTWSTIAPRLEQARTTFLGLPRPYQVGIPAITVLLLIGVGYMVFRPTTSDAPAPTPVVATPPTTHPADPGETNQNMGELTVAIASLDGMVSSLILNDELYIIMPTGVRTLSGETYPLPSGRVQFATAMNDLRLIFVATDRGTLYAWSPITKKYIENTLPLEAKNGLSGIGSYLTYLYALDSATDQIYRFPRAEGGFGAGTPWLRDTVTIEPSTRLSVNETLYLMLDPSTIRGYFRGRASSTFESPADGMSIVSLYTFPGLQNVYGLDATHHRILIWNQDGRLIRELSHEKFSDGRTLSVNEKNGELFIGTADSLLSFKLK